MFAFTRTKKHGAAFAAVAMTSALILTGCSSVAPRAVTATTSEAGVDGEVVTAPVSEEEQAFAALNNLKTDPATTVRGDIAFGVEDVNITADLDLKYGKEFGSSVMNFTVESPEFSIEKVTMSTVGDNAGEVAYVKIDNLVSTVDEVMKNTGGDEASIAPFKPALNAIDGKYVKMDAKELEALSGEEVGAPDAQACTKDMQERATDPESLKEVVDLLKDSDALTAKRGGAAKISGEESQGYTFDVDLANALDAGDELAKTGLISAILECQKMEGAGGPSSDELDPEDLPGDLVTTFDVYVGNDSKQLNKFTYEMSSKDEQVNFTGEFTVGYEDVTVEAPAAADTVTLKEAIDSFAPGTYDQLVQTAQAAN
ncbi:hypothetical protein JT358_14655 [Micrococcales bacterium 31B]|nr:hypothetical protein [Micrococcales bacterium 31B]